MYLEEEEFIIGKFARRPVQRLSNTSTLIDAIELMNDFDLRYIPVVEGVNLLGVVDTLSLTKALLEYTDRSTLQEPVTELINDDFFKVNENESVLTIIKKIAVDQPRVAFLMDGYVFQGMFTDYDILSNDYLWTEVEDYTITSDSGLGLDINEFTCVSADASIQQALQLMLHLKSDIIGLIDDHSKVLVGTLSIMDLVQYLIYQIKEEGRQPDRIFEVPLNTIFPQSGLYVREPISLIELRNRMMESNSPLAILLDKNGYPSRMIGVRDLVIEYATHSRFILDVDET